MIDDYKIQHCEDIILLLESQTHGELVNISKMYHDYGSPRGKSPKRLLNLNHYKDLISQLVEDNDYEIEKVIRFETRQIFVHWEIAYKYLTDLYEFISKTSQKVRTKASNRNTLQNIINKDENEWWFDLPF